MDGFWFISFFKKGLILAVFVLCLLDRCGVWFVVWFFFSFIISTFSLMSVFSLFLGNLVLLYQDLVFALFSNKGREKKKATYIIFFR